MNSKKKKKWYTCLTWDYLQIIAIWKSLTDFRKWNPWNLINNGNGK